jgi:hypothetical protein
MMGQSMFCYLIKGLADGLKIMCKSGGVEQNSVGFISELLYSDKKL